MVIEHLTVLYDSECGFCCRCRAWLEQQPSNVELELMSREAPAVPKRFPGLEPGDDELVVVDNAGGVYRGPDAFIVCLWALTAYRPWAMRLANPGLRPLARLAFEMISSQRHRIAEWLKLRSDGDLARAIQLQMGTGSPRCVRPA